MLGPTLITLYSNDLPGTITNGTVYMYEDDTTIFCIDQTADKVTEQLNKALEELNNWNHRNSLVPHPTKCEGMILKRSKITGPLPSLKLGNNVVKWVTDTRLLGVTIDHELTWSKHLLSLKRSFVNKINLLKHALLFSTKINAPGPLK